MTVIGTYDPYLVALSIAIACLASYTALDLGGRIRGSRRWTRLAWIATAAIAMGGGIWSMHFLGMLAFLMPMPVSYDLGLTLLSLIVAIGVSGFGFFMIGIRRVAGTEFVLSGIFMGIGIVAMHYTGMAAMRMPAEIRYDRVLVALSVLIAIGASIAALWLAFRTTAIWQRLLAAAVMGFAISGMHYTGMAAATFIAHPWMDEAHRVPGLAQTGLALSIATSTFVILLLTLVASAFDRKLTGLAERETVVLRKSEEQLRKLYRETPLPLHAVGADGRIEEVSNAWLKLLDYPREDTTGRDLMDFMTEGSKRRYGEIIWPHLQLGEDIQEVECRFVRKSGEVLDVLLNARQERADDKRVRTLGGIVDITARRRAEMGEERLQLALDAAQLGWWQYDPLRRDFSWDERFKKILDVPANGAPVQEFMSWVLPEDAGRVEARIYAVLDPTRPRSRGIEFRITRQGDGEVRWVETLGLPYFEGEAPDRRAISVLGTIADITERKEREEKERLLMREVNHRARNMLSVVDAIAHQTVANSPEDYAELISERIRALAAYQDLLVRSEWTGVEIEDLARVQVSHFADLIGSRIVMNGPKLRLNPASAQAIGLALHELTANAGNYGALSTEAGRVDVGWGTDGDTLHMSWTERDGPPVSRPKRRGFGSTVMATMAERTVDGKVDLDFAPSGLTWRLTCPAANALQR